MKPQFQHKLATSYMLWFENFLLKKSEAYSLQTGIFTHYIDDRLPSNFETFGSNYKQIAYDSSLKDIYIPSGVYVDNNYVEFDGEYNFFDFDNGRFISSEFPSGSLVTGSFTAKDISIYYTNDTEEGVVLNVQEQINNSVENKHEFYAPQDQKLPAIYLSNQTMENVPFAFGGMNETITKTKAIVIANNSYDLDCVLSIFCDSYNEVIPLCDFDSHPINEVGSLKNNYYSYEDVKQTYTLEKLFVKDVKTSKLSDKLKQNLLKDLYIGFIDFDLSIFRYRS
jgi:hypothetical protein